MCQLYNECLAFQKTSHVIVSFIKLQNKQKYLAPYLHPPSFSHLLEGCFNFQVNVSHQDRSTENGTY